MPPTPAGPIAPRSARSRTGWRRTPPLARAPGARGFCAARAAVHTAGRRGQPAQGREHRRAPGLAARAITRRLADRPAWQRGMDTFVKWRRGFLLSSPVTLGKLTAAAMQRVGDHAHRGGPGRGVQPGAPSWPPGRRVKAAPAWPPRRGPSRPRSPKAWRTPARSSRPARARKIFYMRPQRQRPGEHDVAAGGQRDRVRRHSIGALKAPVKAAEFTTLFEKARGLEHAQGVDVTDRLATRIASRPTRTPSAAFPCKTTASWKPKARAQRL